MIQYNKAIRILSIEDYGDISKLHLEITQRNGFRKESIVVDQPTAQGLNEFIETEPFKKRRPEPYQYWISGSGCSLRNLDKDTVQKSNPCLHLLITRGKSRLKMEIPTVRTVYGKINTISKDILHQMYDDKTARAMYEREERKTIVWK